MRNGRRSSRRRSVPGGFIDPFVALEADRAWRADDGIDDGTVTTALANYIGAPLLLPTTGTGQPIKNHSANFGNARSITFSPGQRGYGNVVAFAVAPTAITVASVVRVAAINRGWFAVTNAGATNSGFAQLFFSNPKTRKLAVDADGAGSQPLNLIQVSVFTASGITDYSNAITGVTTASAGALVGTTLHLCEVDAAGTFAHSGEWVTGGYFLRALSAKEIAFAMRQWSKRYRISIA